jgi:hypothetical protein
VSTAASEQPQLDDFWAVVLYAPEEAIWCSWIHRQLDGILVPEAMVGRPTRHGFPLPATITIFPNPEDPGKVSAYAEAVRKARYLIVVCSPASADAESVEQQIRAFKRTGGEGGEERIVVLVVERELDEESNTSTGKGGENWLPPWIRWRVGEDGQFRTDEPGEPLIIDARPGRLSLDDARGALMSILMDFGRTDHAAPAATIFENAPTLSPVAAPTRVPAPPAAAARQAPGAKSPAAPLPKMAPIAPVAMPSAKKGIPILAISAVVSVLALGFAIWMWMNPPPAPVAKNSEAAVPSASTPDPQTTTIVPPESSTPEPPPVAVASNTSVVPSPSAVPPPAPEPDRGGPITSISPPYKAKSELASTTGAVSGDTALDRWRKLRELGDTLIERENRDAGIIALAQASEAAEKYVQGAQVSTGIRLEAARLCFRLGALQKQFYSKNDAEKTMARARRILDRTKAAGEEATERRQLIDNIDTFLAGMKE